MPKVLVIDDEKQILESTVESLQYLGFEVLQALGGWQGIQIVREQIPDIIVCDINMPNLDGFEVLEILQSESMTATIPFIFLSARAAPSDIRMGMNRGADDYLTKPFDAKDLEKAIYSRLVRNSRAQLDRLREFSHRLVTAQENERHNFSVILKENIIDKLADLRFTLNMIERLPLNVQSSAIETTKKLLETTVESANAISHTLWPSVLAHLGLLPAILLLIDQVYTTSNIRVEFEHHGLERVEDPRMSIMLYRIIQEALTNIEKHAAVNMAHVRLWVEQETLHLHIEDHGIGFNVEKALREAEKTGIMGMQERAYLLNGELTILSTASEGTRIFGIFPFPPDKVQPDSRIQTHQPAPNQQMTPSRREQTSDQFRQISAPIIRVAIADANQVMSWGIRSLLDKHPRFAAVHEVADWPSLVQVLETVDLDILIVSLTLPGNHEGDAIIHQVSENFPSLRILLLSSYIEFTYAAEALKNGAHGYLLKTSSSEEILEALDALASGRQYIAKDVVNSTQRETALVESDTPLNAFSTLTERERQIFYRVVNGDTNQQIAEMLTVSLRTVETHRINMMRKLGLRGLPALLRFALDRGIVGR